jgi:LuxR family maltose regulon positive regulatory protein
LKKLYGKAKNSVKLLLGNACRISSPGCILSREIVGEHIAFFALLVVGSMMAKITQAALIWAQEQRKYLWRDTQYESVVIGHEEIETWRLRVAEHTSFSFQGKEGQLTLLKETRPRGGEGYWYAYRRQGKRTVKKYLGRTTDLTIARLEQTASALLGPPTLAGDAQEDGRNRDPSKDNGENFLLVPSLHLPRLHPSLIVRERLLSLLDRGLEGRLTLITAPAGSGKTTLARQWIAERSGQQDFPPAAWISLGTNDNDPVRFWHYLMTACHAFKNGLAYDALAQLHATPQPPFENPRLETALTVFLNALAQYEQRGMIFLDNYHIITSPRIQETVAFFLDHLPIGIHIVVIARSDPPFPLAQLRVRDELSEVRTSDLRFSHEEARTFLQQTLPTPSDPRVVQRINTHLEGWGAGLRLLQIALQRRTLPTRVEPFLRAFVRSQQTLQEYFLAEVLSVQPEPLQRFLLQTSVLGRLTGSLCDTVTGEHNSEQLLESLERTNLFLEPLDNTELPQFRVEQRWYRYHGLFAEAMRTEARHRLGDEQLRAISSHASHWYEARNLSAEAVESALYAWDYERAAILIERVLQGPHNNEYHTLYNWLEQIPEEVLKQHPILCLGFATALLLVVATWQLPPTALTLLENFLQMAEERFRAEHNLPRLGEVFAFRSLAAWRQDEAVQAALYANQALLWLPEEQRVWRSLSLSVVGKAELLFHGRVDKARAMLEEAAVLCEATHNQYFRHVTITMLATVFFEQGSLHRAEEHYRRALSDARERSHSNDIGQALLGLARVSYEHNKLETAHQQAEEVLAIGQYLAHERLEIQATLLLTRIHHAWGETMVARQRLAALLTKLPTAQPTHPSPLVREALSLQALLALANNDLAAVQRWLTDSLQAVPSGKTMSPFSVERETLILARWQLIQGQAEEALEALPPLLSEARAMGRKQSAFEGQILLVLAYAAHKQKTEALQHLQELLTQTYAEGYLRLFLDESQAMMTLLRALAAYVHEQPLRAYIQTILQAFPEDLIPSHNDARISMQHLSQTESVTLPALLLREPLSSQERRVLRHLVLGRSNAEIAGELIVSINTVRTQVQSIYRKLDVHNRAEAGEVARQHGLV